MRAAWLAPMAVLVGACGTQELRFGLTDAGTDSETDSSADAAPGRRGCAIDSDCPLSLHCDTSFTPSGQCVECIRDYQCPDLSYTVCDSELHRCVQCLKDSDCQDGRCEPTTHRCILSCSDGGLCPRGFLGCDQPANACIECRNDTYCSSNRPWCDPAIDQCVQCIDDSNCSGDQHCDRPLGRCVECLDSSNCRSWEGCNPDGHYCVDLRSGVFDGGQSQGTVYRDAGSGVGYDAHL